MAIDPSNHLRVAALVPPAGGLVRSLDGGETWTPGNVSCPVSSCGGKLVADPGGSGALLMVSFGLSLSRDWGATFRALGPPGPGSASVAAFDPTHPGWIYVGTSAGTLGAFWLSTDYGATWNPKASPSTGFSFILNLAVDLEQPATLVATTPDGLYKSTDGARSWTRTTGPGPASFSIEGFDPFVLLSHRCASGGGLAAIGSGGAPSFQVAFSQDYGATWMTPQLTSVTGVTAGPSCAVYVMRQGTSDVFVSKLAPDGTALWTTYFGGADQDVPVALALDAQGNAYVAGNTTSPDFPSTVARIGPPGQGAVFVARFTPAGMLAYSALIGGEARTTAIAMAVDPSGNAYVAGSTNSQAFPITPGTLVTKTDPATTLASTQTDSRWQPHLRHLPWAHPALIPGACWQTRTGRPSSPAPAPRRSRPTGRGPHSL